MRPDEPHSENPYERERAERIKRNQAMLAKLQVKELARAVQENSPAAVAAEAERQRRAAVNSKFHAEAGPLRRSVRAKATVMVHVQGDVSNSDSDLDSGEGRENTDSSTDSSEQSERVGLKRKQNDDMQAYDPADESSGRSSVEADDSWASASDADAGTTSQPPNSGAQGSLRARRAGASASGEASQSELPGCSEMTRMQHKRRRGLDCGATDAEKKKEKRRHRHKHKHKRTSHAKLSPPAKLGRVEVEHIGEDEDADLQRALALSLAECCGQQADVTFSNVEQAASAAAVAAAASAATREGDSAKPSAGHTVGPGCPSSVPASIQEKVATQADVTEGPARSSTGKGKGSRRQSKVKRPTDEESEQMFQQLSPQAGSLSQSGLHKAAEQLLSDGLEHSEIQNMLQYAARTTGCAPEQLNRTKFSVLLSHLYD